MTQRSKRQQRRDQNQNNSRTITIIVIALGALLLAIALIYPNIKPATEVVVPEQVSRPQTEGLTVGDPNAPAKIEVFEDFQCPACKKFTENFEPRILSELVNTGKAYYVFHNYPFLDRNSTTKESHDAANASLCANEQGKFWEYHDTLFANWNGENQGAFKAENLIKFATAIGLNESDFAACVKENRYADEVQKTFDLGNSMGVSGTPTVFVNGQEVTPGYVPSFDDIAAAVEAAQK
ncbi:MAG: DsbA family protein [Anaerolineales bacterium]